MGSVALTGLEGGARERPSETRHLWKLPQDGNGLTVLDAGTLGHKLGLEVSCVWGGHRRRCATARDFCNSIAAANARAGFVKPPDRTIGDGDECDGRIPATSLFLWRLVSHNTMSLAKRSGPRWAESTSVGDKTDESLRTKEVVDGTA